MTKESSAERLCRTCRQRMDAVMWSAARHPGCSSSPPISDQAEAQLIGHLATSLGARRDHPIPTSKEN